jgi:histidine triad (HIT) family protein
MTDCIFCKIAAGDIPAKIVYQDELIVAFDDIRPQAPVHTLIIPREHFAALPDVPDGRGEGSGLVDGGGLLAHILLKAPQIAAAKGVAGSGYRVVLNTGPDSGQDVFHVHFHLLGGRRLGWPPG